MCCTGFGMQGRCYGRNRDAILRAVIRRSQASLLLLGVSLLEIRALCAQACPSPLVVNGPVIVAFSAPAATDISQKADDEAQADFEYYSGRVGEPLKRLGIEFCEVNAGSFPVRIGSRIRVIAVKKIGIGYYMVAANKRPRILRGVETDTDLLAEAKAYFAKP